MPARKHTHLKRLVQMALQNLFRNGFLSVATALMMGLILFIFNVVLVLNLLTQSSLSQLSSKVDLLIYLSDSVSVLESTELLEDLRKLPGVTEVNYQSKENALEEFLDVFPEKEDPFTRYGLENPLPASIQVFTKSPQQHQEMLDYLNNSVYAPLLLDVESSDENQAIVEKLLQITRFTKQLVFGVTLAFLLGSLMMIANAIHLSIYTRKTEIHIMQLVGARPFTLFTPFLLEGAFYGLIGSLIGLVLIAVFVEGTQLHELVVTGQEQNIFFLAGIELAVSMLVGVLSSFVATKRHLTWGL